MKLLVIVLCLLSERFFIHQLSHNRFYWFSAYLTKMSRWFKSDNTLVAQSINFAILLLPLLLILSLILTFINHLFFGIIALIVNLIVFYYCLGPQNPFYPIRLEQEESDNQSVKNYFSQVNSELFAIIFWYILTGPLGILFYRFIYLSRDYPQTAILAQRLMNLLDWIPARITVLLYLLVGNFQRGFYFFAKMFFTAPENNELLLAEGGLLAASAREEDVISLPYAESLVEHALIVCLVLLAFFTLVAWL